MLNPKAITKMKSILPIAMQQYHCFVLTRTNTMVRLLRYDGTARAILTPYGLTEYIRQRHQVLVFLYQRLWFPYHLNANKQATYVLVAFNKQIIGDLITKTEILNRLTIRQNFYFITQEKAFKIFVTVHNIAIFQYNKDH